MYIFSDYENSFLAWRNPAFVTELQHNCITSPKPWMYIRILEGCLTCKGASMQRDSCSCKLSAGQEKCFKT